MNIVNATCPYCSLKQSIPIEDICMQLVGCYLEVNGCGRPFVIKPQTHFTADVYTVTRFNHTEDES